MEKTDITDEQINDLIKQLEESVPVPYVEDIIDKDADDEYIFNLILKDDSKKKQEVHETVVQYQSFRIDMHDANGEYCPV